MAAESMIGVTLGNYRITSKLGQGGMGAVYLAEHDVLGRKAAIKVLLPQLSHQGESVRRFFHEARMTANLRHPAMVDVFDYGTLPDGRAFLVMDYLEGECLEERIDRVGPMPPLEALIIARQIAVGVSVAHAAQIVHRDLKPDNLFLLPAAAGSADERIKILDFGIAKLVGSTTDRITRAGTLIGTPLYMSPEQCLGNQDVDARADIYSLGCILFTMLAARPPFVGTTMAELVTQHVAASVPRLSSLGIKVPLAVEDLLAILLEKKPERRLPTMNAVALRIAVILQDAGVSLGGASSELLPRPASGTDPQRSARAPSATSATSATSDSSIRKLRKRLSSTMPVAGETVSAGEFEQAADTSRQTTKHATPDTATETAKDLPAAQAWPLGPRPDPQYRRELTPTPLVTMTPPRAVRKATLVAGALFLAGAAVAVALVARERAQSRAVPAGAPAATISDSPPAVVPPPVVPPPIVPPPSTPPTGAPVAPPSPPHPVETAASEEPAAQPTAAATRAERKRARKKANLKADPDASPVNNPVYRGSRLEIEKRLPY